MFKILLFTLACTHGTDAGSSLYAFSHGAYEVNPLIISTRPAPFLLEVGATSTASVWLLARLHRHHPRIAWTLALAGTTLETAATIHNIRTLRSARY